MAMRWPAREETPPEVEDEVINTVGFAVIAAPVTPQFGQQHMKVPA